MSEFFDEVGGFEPNRYRRTKPRRRYNDMGLGPRRKDNDMRDRQGKMVGVFSLPKGNKATAGVGSAGGGSKNKQYNQTGKKYNGPNYPQPDKTIDKSGGLK